MSKIVDIIKEDAQRIISRVDLSPLTDKWVTVTGATGIIGTYVLAVLATFGRCKAVHPVATRFPEDGHPAKAFFPDPWEWTKINLAKGDSDPIIPVGHYLLYAAGYGQPTKFTANPLATLSINTKGLLRATQSLMPHGRLLYISSSEIYSGNNNPPHSETSCGSTTPQHPRACYIEAKRCGEAICHSFNQGNRFEATALAARVALSYGPGTRKDDDRAINQFIRQALLEGEIRLRDAGTAERTYCYITDCVERLFSIWLYGRQEVYNVGGYSHLTIRDLAEKIGKYCGVPVWAPPMVNVDYSPKVVDLDISRIKNEFGATITVPIDEGLARTIEWQKELYGLCKNES